MDTVDVRAPLLSIYSDCGNCIVTASDNRKLTLSKDSFQLDVGIRDVPVLLKARSNNYKDIIIDPKYTKDSIYYEMIFQLEVENKFDTAFAVFFVYDNADNKGNPNVKYDSIKYYPQLLDIDKDRISYGQIYLDSTSQQEIVIKNVAGFNFLIKDVSLKYGTHYRIINPIKKNYEITESETIILNIEYKPQKEIINNNQDYDTLIIKNECLIYKIPLDGQGVVPRIIVEDFDFDICEVGSILCKDKISFPSGNDGIIIRNPGTGILKINNYRFNPTLTPYKLINPEPDLTSAQLFPNTSLNLKSICFEPRDPGEFFGQLIISSNSMGPDSIANFRGIAYNKGPYLRKLNFGDKRVLSKSKGFVTIKNSDTKPYYLYDIDLSDDNSGFRIVFEDMNIIPSKATPIVIYPESSNDNVLKEYLIPVEFFPLDEGFKEIKIFPRFMENNQDLNLVLFNYIRGTGFLPALQLMGHYFNGKTLVNTFHKDTGFVSIFSKSQYADLYIKSMKVFKQNDNSNDFLWINENFPKDTILERGKSIKIPILFKPEEEGERILIIQLVTDATKGDGENWDTTYTELKGIGYNKIISVDLLNFKDVIHCDSAIGKLVVSNVSDTATTEIYEILFDTEDINPFYIDKTIFLTSNIVLEPKDTFSIDVVFKPFVDEKFNYSVMTKVLSDDDTSTTFIKGNSIKYNVSLISDTSTNGMPGMITLDKEPDFIGTNYNIRIFSEDIQYTYLDSVYFELVYHKNHFRFMNYIEKGNLIKDWNINFNETEINKDTNKLSVLCYGLTPIKENGILITPAFMIMLGDTNGVKFDIRNVSFFEKESCSFPEIINGFIDLSYCGEELRKIQISSHLYGFSLVNGNIIDNNKIIIAYNIAFSASGNIDIYNQYGENIYSKKLSDSKSGKYLDQINLPSISSGVYFIHFKSGPYSKIEKFIINK